MFSKYKLWNYLNYFLLQSIIEVFASSENHLKVSKWFDRSYLLPYLEIPHYVLSIITTNGSENSTDEIVPVLPTKKQAFGSKSMLMLQHFPYFTCNDTSLYCIDIAQFILTNLAKNDQIGMIEEYQKDLTTNCVQ